MVKEMPSASFCGTSSGNQHASMEKHAGANHTGEHPFSANGTPMYM